MVTHMRGHNINMNPTTHDTYEDEQLGWRETSTARGGHLQPSLFVLGSLARIWLLHAWKQRCW